MSDENEVLFADARNICGYGPSIDIAWDHFKTQFALTEIKYPDRIYWDTQPKLEKEYDFDTQTDTYCITAKLWIMRNIKSSYLDRFKPTEDTDASTD